jgi:hypothetical protein
MNRTVTHKHLRKAIEDFDETEDVETLFNELKFSSLLIPIIEHNGEYTSPVIMFGEEKFVPLFTDIYEAQKVGFENDFIMDSMDIFSYLDLIDDEIEGFIINVESERFPLTKEFKEWIEPSPLKDPKALSADEIRQTRQSIDNAELNDFLKNPDNRYDFESMKDLLLSSDLLTVIVAFEDLSDKSQDGIIKVTSENIPICVSQNIGTDYAVIYSSSEGMKYSPKNGAYPYLQLVNLSELIYSTLMNDLDGIILNRETDNITLPREFLINHFDDFNCENPEAYKDYAFEIE